jgi:hypothetical protein
MLDEGRRTRAEMLKSRTQRILGGYKFYCIEPSAETRHIEQLTRAPVSTNPKVPIERRRRTLVQDLRESFAGEHPKLRRESDQIKARLLRWISLADQALGRQGEDEARGERNRANSGSDRAKQ